MGFRSDREALEAKLRAREQEIEALRAEVEALHAPPSTEPTVQERTTELRESARELRRAAQEEMASERHDDEPLLAFLPWWVHLLAYAGVAALGIMIAFRSCGGS